MSIHRAYLMLLAVLLFTVMARPATAQSMPPVNNPANGHWYQAVLVAGAITWDDARAAAQSLSYAGYHGHLVTITSAAENDFILKSVLSVAPKDGRLWLGGYQDGSASDYIETAGGWRWVTGEPWSYTGWLTGEPNNYGGNEDALEFHQKLGWNDFPHSAGLNGYVVEYEPTPIGTGPLLSIQPNPVVGGQPASGQVILAQPAGLGGVILTLTSSNPTAAVAPASVTVPTGANTFSFPITTFPVGSPTATTISVSYTGGTASASLQVLPSGGSSNGSTPIYNPANGHWYQIVTPTSPISWQQARDAAAVLSYAGLPGHLATITSVEENQFIWTRVIANGGGKNDYLLGGYQDKSAPDYKEPAGGWRWVTGEPFVLALWGPLNPSNTDGIEDVLGFWRAEGDRWNDFNPAPRAVPFIVEYEPLPITPPVSSGNLLVNGSFEQPIVPAGLANRTLSRIDELPGWRILRGSVDVVPPLPSDWQPAPGQGNQSLDLVGTPGAATIEQTVATEPGRDYIFSGWLSHNYIVSEGRANGFLNGQFFVQLYHSNAQYGSTSPDNMRWQPFSYQFRAATATTTLTLVDVTGLSVLGGTVLDGLSIAAAGVTPSPQSPAAPINLMAQVVSAGQVNLSWTDNSSNETGFAIYRRTGAADWTRIALIGPNITRFTDWSVNPGTTYAYRVQAVNDAGTSDWSNEISGTIPGAQPPPPVPQNTPAAPTNLSAKAVSASQIDLTWTDNSDNEVQFILYRKSGSGDFARIGQVNANLTNYSDRGLSPNTSYTYLVRAWNPAGASRRSNEASATTLSVGPAPLAAPNAPTDLTAKAVSATQIDLVWADRSDNEAVFVLYRKSGNGDYVRVATVERNGTSYSDRGLTPGTTYTYEVLAWNPSGASRASNTASATTPLTL